LDHEPKNYQVGYELQPYYGNTCSNWRIDYAKVRFCCLFTLVIVLICLKMVSVSLFRELVASFNKITVLPPEIGKLKRLRRLVLNSNKIKQIPDDVGQLEMLEEFIISENSVEAIPVSLSLMANLKIFKLANNKLKTIPFEIADILTLEEIDCANNPHLDILPAMWRGNTESVLFTCRVHRG
jgi:hypothetical protein